LAAHFPAEQPLALEMPFFVVMSAAVPGYGPGGDFLH
jgi:hypothetical protein